MKSESGIGLSADTVKIATKTSGLHYTPSTPSGSTWFWIANTHDSEHNYTDLTCGTLVNNNKITTTDTIVGSVVCIRII